MRIIKLCFLIIWISILFTSCVKHDFNIYDITGNVECAVIERYTGGPNGFVIFLSTKQDFKWSENSKIDYVFSFSNNRIDIKLKHILVPKEANGKMTHVQLDLFLGKLKPGTYPISVKIGSTENNFSFHLTDSLYYTDDAKLINMEIYPGNYRRIPDNVLWGAFSYLNKQDSLKGISFVDSLNKYPVSPIKLPDGNYQWFTMTNGNIFVNLWGKVPHYGHERGYIYNYQFDDKLLINLNTYFQSKQDESMFLIIKTTNGTFLRNFTW
jgi:hypothetical protein